MRNTQDPLPEDVSVSVDALDAAARSGAGGRVWLLRGETDKYAFRDGVEIDCASRIELCRAACCRLAFALSEQDVEEGAVLWDPEEPYLIARSGNGDCAHLDPNGRVCGIYEQRPLPCRAFDCREDGRIWVDFERRVHQPDLQSPARGPARERTGAEYRGD
jgi:hypothetical protein